jgi:hypothetical protein
MTSNAGDYFRMTEAISENLHPTECGAAAEIESAARL